MLKPTEDRVVVLPDEAETKSKGGIVIPDVAKEKPAKGTVVAVGPGRTLESGLLVGLPFKANDRVLFQRYGGNEIELDGKTYRILKASEVLAVFDK